MDQAPAPGTRCRSALVLGWPRPRPPTTAKAKLGAPAQAALLRFLDRGEVQRVGAEAVEHADVRLIGATNANLPAMVDAGMFAVDLYYRLAVVVLEVPPLRARLDDLPLLIEHVRRKVVTRHGLAVEGVTPATLEALAAHAWPGNVRELRHVLEAAMLRTTRRWVEVEDLRLGRTSRAVVNAAEAAAGSAAVGELAGVARAYQGRGEVSAAGGAGDAAVWAAREGSRRAPAETARRLPRDLAALALDRAATHGVVTRGQVARGAGSPGIGRGSCSERSSRSIGYGGSAGIGLGSSTGDRTPLGASD